MKRKAFHGLWFPMKRDTRVTPHISVLFQRQAHCIERAHVRISSYLFMKRIYMWKN